MSKVIILGSGAAPGVPSLAYGFGDCDPKEEKNIRLRSGTYMEISGVKLLIDTSPDLRMQLILSNIRDVDAVFYTHAHADICTELTICARLTGLPGARLNC